MATDAPPGGERARLAEEQASLLRVAALRAEGAPDAKLIAAVAEEIRHVLHVDTVSIDRIGPDGSSTLVACLGAKPPSLHAPVVVDGVVRAVVRAGTAGPDTGARLVELVELLAPAIADYDGRRAVADLVDERAALRRVAALVAGGAPASDLFTVVGEEVGRLFHVVGVTINRYEDGECVVLSDPQDSGFPVGSRWPLDVDGVSTKVLATGRPARVEDYSRLPGATAAAMRSLPWQSAVGVPIAVGGHTWGVICIGARTPEALPADTELRVARFAELVAMAIADSEARDGLRALAEEQAALRRVATLVAEQAPAAQLFAAVAEEVGQVLAVPGVSLDRYEADGTTTVVSAWGVIPFSVGTRWPVEPGTVAQAILATGAPARVNDYAAVRGQVAEVLDGYPRACIVGAPIVVDGRVWGMIGVGAPWPGTLPPDTESRLAAFTELVATAIANSEARLHLRALVDEQAALRRVATLVAKGTSAAELFAGVAAEVARVVGIPMVTLSHYESDQSFTVVGSANCPGFPVGTRWLLDGPSLGATIFDTGRAARIDDYTTLSGEVAGAVRDASILAAVGAPILVEGRVWGHISTATTDPEPLPPDAEERLAGFAELISNAIANGEARDDLRRLFAEQAALRRVATLVARGTSATDLFTAVARAVAEVVGVSVVSIDRYDPDGHSTVLASLNDPFFPAGSRWPLDGPSLAATVLETGRPARVDDYSELDSASAAAIRASSVTSTVGAPIVVDGTVWGVICVATTEPAPLPRDTEERLVRFTELVATAVSNTTTRAEVMASRVRLVAAGDEARRRIERTLHDRTQQQLIALGLDLQAVRAGAAPELVDAHVGFDRLEQEIASVREEVRELARGLHPALRARGGLGPSLRALAHGLPVRVDFAVEVRERLAEPVETGIYYVVSEALTNVIKHANATRVSVTVTATDMVLRAAVEDDGVGGAEVGRGSGLTGLIDRVSALGGLLTVESPLGEGTRMAVDLPLHPAAEL